MSWTVAIASLGNFYKGTSKSRLSFALPERGTIAVDLTMPAEFALTVDEFREKALEDAVRLLKSAVADLEAMTGAELNALEKEGGT